MLLVTKNKSEIYNADVMDRIFVASDGVTVRISSAQGNTRAGLLGEYSTRETTLRAVEVLAKRMGGSSKIVYMPQEEEVKVEYETWHHATGKKTKGHGGS